MSVRFKQEAMQRGWAQVPNVLLEDTRLSIAARMTWAILAKFAWDSGKAHPGQGTLATLLGVQDRAVRGYLAELKEAGWLEVQQRGLGMTNMYWLVFPDLGGTEMPAGPDPEDRSDRLPGTDKEDTGEEDSSSTKKRKRSTGTKAPVAEPITFGEWIGYHCIAAERTVPRAGTSARAKLAATYAALEAEGYSLDDLKLASDGVLANAFMVEHGFTKPENVLRKEKISGRIDDGRQARAKAEQALSPEEQRKAEWREQQRIASEYQPEDPYAEEGAA